MAEFVPAVERSPLVVVWRITEVCRLACGFCGYSRAVDRPRASADADDVRRFGSILGDYSRLTGRKVLVSWLGGEPLEWPPLPELSRVFQGEYELQLGVTTSGTPLRSSEIRRLLCETYDQVTVSIDGLGQFHDRVRHCPGLFAAVGDHVARLLDESGGRLLLRVNTILMRGNIAAFPAFCEQMLAWGFRELTFNQLGGNDRPEFFPHNRLLPAQVDRFRREFPALRSSLAQRGLDLRGSDRYLDRIARTTRGQPLPVEDCAPGTRFLFIDEQGRISPCSFTASGYGISLRQFPAGEAMQRLPQLFGQARRRERQPACADCHATHVFDKFW